MANTSNLPQNFSIAQDTDDVINGTIITDIANATLVGSTMEWCLYPSLYGGPTQTTPILTKTSHSGGDVTILPTPPMSFTIRIHASDTFGLALGNYYHEAVVTDPGGARTRPWFGLMTLTQTQNP